MSLPHLRPLLVEELLHFDLHAGGMVVHYEEEGDGACPGQVLHTGEDTRVKAVKEESMQLDNVVVQGQLAQDLILASKLVPSLRTYMHRMRNADLVSRFHSCNDVVWKLLVKLSCYVCTLLCSRMVPLDNLAL